MLIRDLNKRQSIHPSIQSMKKIKDFFLLQKWQFFAQSLQMLIVEQKKYMWSGIEFYILGNTFGCQIVNLKIDIFEEKKGIPGI